MCKYTIRLRFIVVAAEDYFLLTESQAKALSTRYAHMVSTAVSAGNYVSAGDVIGYVGTTGDSTGNHLHWEAYVGGVRVDPLGMAG